MYINRNFLAFSRTIHIYLSMLGLCVMLLFGITGFTAYHEDLFGAATSNQSTLTSTVPVELLKKDTAIIEHLRSAYGITGAVNTYSDAGDTISITYKRPGGEWQAQINKADGKLTLTTATFNAWAVLNDLHRGRSAGRAWGWVIDISAALIVLACITGVILWLALPKRQQLGILFMLLGVGITLVVFFFMVPGRDTHRDAEKSTAVESAEK